MKLQYDEQLSNFAFNFNLRRYDKALRILKDKFKNVPVMGLTATATKRVQDDCVQQLGLTRCTRFFQTFNRINIKYEAGPGTYCSHRHGIEGRTTVQLVSNREEAYPIWAV